MQIVCFCKIGYCLRKECTAAVHGKTVQEAEKFMDRKEIGA